MIGYKEKKKRMEFIQSYIPTSRAQLIQIAMWYHKGNVEKAQEMVDFYTKNMTLPDFDPAKPTTFQQFRTNVSDAYKWFKDNQNDLLQGYQFIRDLIKNKGELPSVTSGHPAATLPEINP